MGTTPWSGQQYVHASDDSAAVFISWEMAHDFIDALNVLTGKQFRLPSEAEWEYAARAGSTTRFYWGDDASLAQIGAYAHYQGSVTGLDNANAGPVGQLLPNAWGLYDMSGNAWELCEDWYPLGGNYDGAPTDGSAWLPGPEDDDWWYRIRRGGFWYSLGADCRSARRTDVLPGTANADIGFRLAR